MVITEYGAFVEVLPGVEGLIHVSEMSWTQHVRSPRYPEGRRKSKRYRYSSR